GRAVLPEAPAMLELAEPARPEGRVALVRHRVAEDAALCALRQVVAPDESHDDEGDVDGVAEVDAAVAAGSGEVLLGAVAELHEGARDRAAEQRRVLVELV